MREGIPFKESPEQRISTARSFDELKSVLYILKRIHGSQKVYLGEEVVDQIDQVRSGDLEVEYITRTWNLRNKVKELLLEENKTFKQELDKIAGVNLE
jgi:hypothetical protein